MGSLPSLGLGSLNCKILSHSSYCVLSYFSTTVVYVPVTVTSAIQGGIRGMRCLYLPEQVLPADCSLSVN